MDEATVIRAARPADARAMAEVAVASWRAAYAGLMPDALLASQSVPERAARFRALMEDEEDDRTFLIAERDGFVVGYASTGATRDEDLPAESGELYALYVHPDAWGTGVASPLLDRAVEDLRSCGFAEVSLWVLATNERARRFYARAGFSIDPRAAEVVKVLRGFELPHTRMLAPLSSGKCPLQGPGARPGRNPGPSGTIRDSLGGSPRPPPRATTPER